MNQTTNYQLSQWEASDRILMSDFNNDNAKIDAALAGHDTALAGKADAADVAALETEVAAVDQRAGARLIKTLTATTSGTSYDFMLDGVDWAGWREIHLVLDLYMDDALGATAYACGSSAVMCQPRGNTIASRDQHTNFGHMVLYPLFDSRHSATLLDLTGGELRKIGYTFDLLEYIHLEAVSNHTIKAGSVLEIWGTK